MEFNTKQIRAGIVLAGLTDSMFAELAGITPAALSNLLAGKSQPQEETRRKITRKLEDLGIEFLPQAGVRQRSELVRIFEGEQGYRAFCDDRYSAALNSSNDFVYCGTNTQADITKTYSADYHAFHTQRMRAISHFKMRGIRPMTDTAAAVTDYIEYRALPLDEFPPVRFYVYGGKVAFLQLVPEYRVIVINDRAQSEDFRTYFERLWQKARPAHKTGGAE